MTAIRLGKWTASDNLQRSLPMQSFVVPMKDKFFWRRDAQGERHGPGQKLCETTKPALIYRWGPVNCSYPLLILCLFRLTGAFAKLNGNQGGSDYVADKPNNHSHPWSDLRSSLYKLASSSPPLEIVKAYREKCFV